jgi:succinoglycan biosynthesis transport protein ExoP
MRLAELWRVIRARKWRFLAILGSVLLFAILLTLYIPDAYLGTASMVLDYKGTDPVTGTTSPGELMPINLATQIEIINSPRVAGKVVDRLHLERNPAILEKYRESGQGSIHDWITAKLQEKLTVEPSHQSNVIDIGFSAPDPQFAALVANAFAAAYMETDFELSMDPAGRQTGWFDKQLQTLKSDLQAAQERLMKFQQKHNVVGNDDKVDVEDGRLVELTNQLVLAQSVMSDTQTRQHQMKEALKKGQLEQLPDILGNGLLQSMKADIVRAEGKLSEVAQKYGKNHPQHQSAVAELQTLKAKFNAEIETATGAIDQSAQIAAQRVVEVQQLVEQQKKRILTMRQERDNVTVLQREVDVAQHAYDALSSRATEIRLQSQLNQSSVAILDTATAPLHPYRPKPVLNIALALVFGSLLAAVLCSSAEVKDPRLRETAGLLEVVGLPVLVRIPAKRRRKLPWRSRAALTLPAPAGGG